MSRATIKKHMLCMQYYLIDLHNRSNIEGELDSQLLILINQKNVNKCILTLIAIEIHDNY